MTDEATQSCPECKGEGQILLASNLRTYAGIAAECPPDPDCAPCEHCNGTGEITEDDHDAFKYPYGTTIDLRGEKRIVFYEHEGDHVIIWWLPGDEATHGPADATQMEESYIYGQLWAEMEDRWAPSSDDDR